FQRTVMRIMKSVAPFCAIGDMTSSSFEMELLKDSMKSWLLDLNAKESMPQNIPSANRNEGTL
ncbi:MAG: hypothetical protein B7Z63_01115, partial [Ignavibacteriae bacterium 37-53-5]